MQEHSVSIVAIGSELLSGAVVDTNSSFLAQSLLEHGFRVARISVVDDVISQIEEELQAACESTSLVICTGGLGPTTDDLTREAIARVAGVPLELNEASLERLEQFALRRKRPLSENNKQQVCFPQGAVVLENTLGTADAFVAKIKSGKKRQTPVIALPGVPRELKNLLTEKVIPYLQEEFGESAALLSQCLKCYGLSESYVGSVVEKMTLPEGVSVAYRPSFPELQLSFTFVADELSQPEVQKRLEEASRLVKKAIGAEYVFSEDPKHTLASAVSDLLREKRLTLSVAESCTGGMIANQVVSTPGASEFFLASVVTYSNQSKEVLLGVKPKILEQFGAVSEEVAIEMAWGAKHRLGANIAVSITGIAGPDGGTPEKPVGTVWVALVSEKTKKAFCYHIPWDRDFIRKYSSALALDLVRREVLGYPLIWERK